MNSRDRTTIAAMSFSHVVALWSHSGSVGSALDEAEAGSLAGGVAVPDGCAVAPCFFGLGE